jgi:anti-sigma factor RsiW
MKLQSHERARNLMAAARVEGIAASDRDWLDRHLASCHECSHEGSVWDAAILSLRALPVSANPELVRQTSLAVHRRAHQLHAERTRTAALWITTGMSTILIILTAPYVWWAFARFGRIAHIPDAMWQLGFLMWWFLPATILGAVAVWRHTARQDGSS